MNWSSYLAIGAMSISVVLMPRSGQVRMKASIAVGFMVYCVVTLLSGVDGMSLIAVPLLATAGLMFLLEMATKPGNKLIPLLWLIAGVDNFVLIAWYRDALVAEVDSRRTWLVIGCIVAAFFIEVLTIRDARRRRAGQHDPPSS